MIIFSISNLLCRYDHWSRLSSVSVIPDHDSNPWSWLSSVSILSSVHLIISSTRPHNLNGKRGLKGALERKRGLKGALEKKMRDQRHARKENEGSKAHLKRREGSKAHLKRSEGSKVHSTWSEAQRRTQKVARAQRCTRKESRARRRARKEVGLGNALPWMVEGSKAPSKGGRIRKRTTFDGQGLEGAFERG